MSSRRRVGMGVLAPVHLHDRNMESKFEDHRAVSWSMISRYFYNAEVFWKFHGFKEESFVEGLDFDYCYKINQRVPHSRTCGCSN